MSVLRIHASPGRFTSWVLSWLLFATGITFYFTAARQRHRENPDDRVMPTLGQMVRAFGDAALKPAEEEEAQDGGPRSLAERLRRSMLWKDTKATGRRFLFGFVLLFPAVVLGLHMAMFPYVGALFLRFIQFFDKIVALSLLPILFIAFGIDELSKVMLIVVGVTPTIVLEHRFVGKQRVLLGHVAAIAVRLCPFDTAYEDTAAGRLFLTENQTQQGRFPATGLPDDRNKFTRLYLEINVVQNPARGLALHRVFHADVPKRDHHDPSTQGCSLRFSVWTARSIRNSSSATHSTYGMMMSIPMWRRSRAMR